MGAFNLSLLGKWCWRMLTEKEGLWYRVLKARYGEEGGQLMQEERYASAWWRMVCHIREGVGEGVGNWFEENIRWVVGDGRDTLFWHDKWIGDIPLRLRFPRLFDLAVNKESKVVDMWWLGWGLEGGAWGWRRRLLAWEEESVRECSMLLHNFVMQDTIHDTWRWQLDPINGYTVRGFYQFITSTGDLVDRSQVIDVWHKHVPSKVSLLVWQMFRNRLPTKDNLTYRGILHANDSTCGDGCDTIENVAHLFLQCKFSSELWSHVFNWLGISFVSSGEL